MQLTLIQNRIFEIRGQKVMLDFHLAELYEVPTKTLNLSVKRNISRFPKDFMFQVTADEYANLRFQNETSRHGGRRYLPYAFTEQGVSMLSSILNSEKAININIFIMRTFVLVRQYGLDYKELEKKINALEKRFNKDTRQIFAALEFLLEEKQQHEDFKNRPAIGFKQKGKD